MFFRKQAADPPQVDIEEASQEFTLKREFTGIYYYIFFGMAIFTTLVHIYYLAVRPVTGYFLFAMHVGLGYSLLLIYYPPFKKSRKDRISVLDFILVALMLFAAFHMIREMHTIVFRIGVSPTTVDLIVSMIVVGVTLECTRRACGNALPVIAILFLLYARFGHFLPGLLGHRGFSWSTILSYMIGMDAIFSTPMDASARMVFMFLVFGAFLTASGAGQFFIDLSMSLAGHSRGGPAKVSVISSALIGTVTGNSVANVVTTGPLTIPLMKSTGYKSHFAAAVEATASTGGQIMPPILGSAAFIMAALIALPYSRIMAAALIPALLYFYTVFVVVDLEAIRYNLKGLDKASLPNLKKIVIERWFLVLPLVVLIYVLAVLGMSIVRSALFGIATCVLVSYFRRSTWMMPKTILNALGNGSIAATNVIAACGTAGIVIGVLNLTGAGLNLAGAIVSFSGGQLWLTLLLTMCTALIVGLGLPTTAAYLICAAVAAPALVQIGLTPLQAHMFVFYFACISAFTPPVALAAYAAAGISKSKPLVVSLTSCKIGVAAFVIPFMFSYDPSLLLGGGVLDTIRGILVALTGVTFIAFGMQRQFMKAPLNILETVAMCCGAIFFIAPSLIHNMIGIIICGGVGLSALFRYRKLQTGAGA